MKLAALISGGKDSIYAAYVMKQQGHKITYLLTMHPKRTDSYMFHHPNIELTESIAKSMNIPLIIGTTKGEKEKELADLEELILKVKNHVDGIITGAIDSKYQKERIDAICLKHGLKSIAPLWHKDPKAYLEELLENKFTIIITAVAADGLDASWLGRNIDKKAIDDLEKINKKVGIHMAGEGGEYETLVLDCPLYQKRIFITGAENLWKDDSGIYKIDDVKLIDK
ncbi:MAG: TIGR00289 family protein [Candidatus Aenigmarchaeota archaeon]|nr:TIGR00289 family protein [Candidatus Aenigmarchaeota archaeon]